MDNLKDLYYKYINVSDKYYSFGQMPEVIEAKENASALIGDNEDIEYVVLGVAAANEMRGWVYGFRYAIT